MPRSKSKLPEPKEALISVTTRIHPEARRRIKIQAARENRSMEEVIRSHLYPALGLKSIPICVETATAS